MAKSKNLTINDLGGMIKDGFDGVNKQLNEVNKRLDKLETGQKELKRDMDEVKMKFAYVAYAIDLDELKQRVKTLEKKAGI